MSLLEVAERVALGAAGSLIGNVAFIAVRLLRAERKRRQPSQDAQIAAWVADRVAMARRKFR